MAVTPTSITFFNGAGGGGLAICFVNMPAPCTEFSFSNAGTGPQMYTGSESAPTMLAGPFTLTTYYVVGTNLYLQPNTTIQVGTPSVPALSPAALAALALLLLTISGWMIRREHGLQG